MMIRFLGLCGILVLSFSAHAQSEVKIKVTPLGPGVHMITGKGGNIGVSSGVDGVFVIDDQYAPLSERLLSAISGFTKQPIRFLINTHWHGDHTGGNENFSKAGALIIAHDNVRSRMSVEQFIKTFDRKVPPSKEIARPVVTFSESTTFHINNDELYVFHVPHAHTDGDAIIHFRKSNVIHMGDTYFAGMYPFIDLSSGGNVDGVIAAVEICLKLADKNTKIIPGHGPLASRSDLSNYHRFLTTVRDRVAKAKAAGTSLDEIKTSGYTSEWDSQWGNGFIKPDRFIEFVFHGLDL